jgi:chemotaxis receptor (MCP) glutamine deamidase CheD
LAKQSAATIDYSHYSIELLIGNVVRLGARKEGFIASLGIVLREGAAARKALLNY